MAVWTYNKLSIQIDMDSKINHLCNTLLADYWPKERALINNNYQDIVMPFTELDAPNFQMSANWNLEQLCGYISTWSATKRYIK